MAKYIDSHSENHPTRWWVGWLRKLRKKCVCEKSVSGSLTVSFHCFPFHSSESIEDTGEKGKCFIMAFIILCSMRQLFSVRC